MKLKNVKLFEELTNESAEEVNDFSEIVLTINENILKLATLPHVKGNAELKKAVNDLYMKLSDVDAINKEIIGA